MRGDLFQIVSIDDPVDDVCCWSREFAQEWLKKYKIAAGDKSENEKSR